MSKGMFQKKKVRPDGTEKKVLRNRSKWGLGALVLAIPGVGSLISTLFGNVLGNANDAGMGIANATMGSALCLPISLSLCMMIMFMMMTRLME
jgi:hypothetical protein